MAKINLVVEKRTVVGKHVKKLRREGNIPLNLYGRGMESINLLTKFSTFVQVYRQAKNTQVVYLTVGKEEYPALIQNVQLHPVSRQAIHADFKRVDLKQKTEVEVPVEIVGENAAVKSGDADLIVLHPKVLVECLPTNIPEKIEVDIAKLDGVGAEVLVKDLPKDKDFEYKLDPELVVVQLAAAQKEEIPEAPAPEAAPEEAAAAPDQQSEGEAKAE